MSIWEEWVGRWRWIKKMPGLLAALRYLNRLQQSSVESGIPSYDLKTCESLPKDCIPYKTLRGKGGSSRGSAIPENP